MTEGRSAVLANARGMLAELRREIPSLPPDERREIRRVTALAKDPGKGGRSVIEFASRADTGQRARTVALCIAVLRGWM